ncbi:bifunctional serine/threonine-protein kinase/ABC transporter substrate-binding protein [Streptomyces phyllanthi]|uniref:ABC transporter substrate-binding protein n=1 Tax=Streptomyces phyllanthi TaxID=1803180 RepID=A0A5N8WEL4_9ACTN|nr:bifunctional serine/threonine-protein kinase/ABC transporter substrate-binding protein [Streptomyces phyllanthi]MPY45931.1 ABC transporter substrate-binding protein [Streptomyces phyllanthi]
MRALSAHDPGELGGHRLLARLGTGGMGVVYLARTADGTLAALKVIRAEYAAEHSFRERFRREARLARGLTGRWLVPVTDADAEAREPWLATAFVPGPSLAEAVDGYGSLPPYAVATLGALLAEALAEVHEAGLVHRDVKPGNVLLALDGPRLIDFGIARATGATALTEPGAVVGTPGYLAPEQVRAGGGAVTASDVYALGCVLAYAATGRRPFGTGNPAAVLYRTVHEEPDLTGLDRLPPQPRTAITRCLAKDPADRPTAAELAHVLTASGQVAPDQADWLPSAVLRLVAERSSRALDPPPRQTGPTAPSEPTVEADRAPSRRRILAVGGSAAAVLAASGTGAAVLLTTRRGTAQGGGDLPTHTIALHAALTGAQAEQGQAQQRGARLAVADHNARKDARFRLALTSYDDRGEAGRAKAGARRLIADPSVRAVVGPTSAAAAEAAVTLYGKASMPVLLVSVDYDALGLSSALTRSLCVTTAPSGYRAIPVVSYLTRVQKAERTAVIQDRAAGAAAEDIARSVRENPPSEGTATVHTVAAGTDDFRPTVAAALATRPEAVVYAGTSPPRAAACARALAAAGFTGPRLAVEPVMRPDFTKAAGEAAEGWVFEAPYSEPQSSGTKAAKAFTAAYRDRYGEPPARWSAEAYDAVGLIAASLDALGGGAGITPGQVAERMFKLTHNGVAKPLRFTRDITHSLVPDDTSFLYRVKDGEFRFLGRHDQVR